MIRNTSNLESVRLFIRVDHVLKASGVPKKFSKYSFLVIFFRQMPATSS